MTSTAIDTLQRKMSRGDVVILDGATGTELERRGVPMDKLAWSATALLTHPEVIREVHEDYIASGADIITTNTFGTLGLSLRSTTLSDRVSELNRTAVRLAQEARARSEAARPIWIGGSMSGMIGTVYWRDAPGSREIIRDSYREQAELLADAGVDLLLLEMTQDVDVGVTAIEAAKGTGLPVWVAISCNFMNSHTGADRPLVVRGSDGRDRPLSEVIDPILAAGGDVAGINHTDVEIMGRALDVLIDKWRGPVSAYPNSGDWTPPNWGFDSVISPMEFATAAESWVARGVQVIGGCCGIGPDHIRLLRDRFDDKQVPIRRVEIR